MTFSIGDFLKDLELIDKQFLSKNGEHIFCIMVVGQVPHSHMVASPVISFKEIPLCKGVVL
jgi:hypothetical protein